LEGKHIFFNDPFFWETLTEEELKLLESEIKKTLDIRRNSMKTRSITAVGFTLFLICSLVFAESTDGTVVQQIQCKKALKN